MLKTWQIQPKKISPFFPKNGQNLAKNQPHLVTLFAGVYNVPRFFELERYIFPYTNETLVRASLIRKNPIYVSVYNTWMKMVRICTLINFLFVFPVNTLPSQSHVFHQMTAVCNNLHSLALGHIHNYHFAKILLCSSYLSYHSKLKNCKFIFY